VPSTAAALLIIRVDRPICRKRLRDLPLRHLLRNSEFAKQHLMIAHLQPSAQTCRSTRVRERIEALSGVNHATGPRLDAIDLKIYENSPTRWPATSTTTC